MHELSLVQELLKILDQNVLDHRLKKVNQIILQVGILSNVVPDSLLFAFEALTQGTVYEEAELVLEEVPVRVLCKICGQEYTSNALPFYFYCPGCQGREAVVLGGTDLVIASLTGEEEKDGN